MFQYQRLIHILPKMHGNVVVADTFKNYMLPFYAIHNTHNNYLLNVILYYTIL